MRTIKTISTDDSSYTADKNGDIPTPDTPVNVETSSKKTRLSLSQSWKNKITQKRQLHTLKRRKLLDTVDKYSEPDKADSVIHSESDICSETEHVENAIPSKSDSNSGLSILTADRSPISEPTSKTKQRIQEIKESITVWRAGCVAALTDLQERRNTGDMESLLNMLQIPLEIVNYDRETQEFLDPDWLIYNYVLLKEIAYC